MSDLKLFLKDFKWQSFWIITSSLFINILALSSSLYVIQIFNRYLSYKIDSTLIILTFGVLLAVAMEFFLRILRAMLVNKISIIKARDHSIDSTSIALSFKLKSFSNLSDQKILDFLKPDLNFTKFNGGYGLILLIDIFFVFLFILTITLLSVKLGIVSAILALVYLLIIKIKLSILKSKNQQRNNLALNTNLVFSDISLLAGTVRAFNGQSLLFSKFKLFFARQRKLENYYKNIIGFFDTISIIIPIFGTVIIIFFGAQEVVNNLLSVGALVGINIISSRIYGPLSRFSVFSNLSDKPTSLIDTLPNKILNENYQGMNPKILKGNISIKNLSIKFENNKEPLFHRFNCFIPSGSVVVINGYNSSGKTSLCKSLLGLLSPSRGAISYDSIDINKIDIKWLRSQISYLPQEVKLFNLTLKENILINMMQSEKHLENDNELDGILLKTINLVGLNNYINQIPDGINQVVQENGKNLPVGIKKRIGLARAIINGGKCLIFDEPTESLDATGLKDLYKILNNAKSLNKTIIIASHDPNILKNAGIIIDLSTKPIPRIGVRKKIEEKNAQQK